MVKKAASRIYLAVIFLFLYLPILVLVVLSFNNSKSRVVWGGFTLKWYASCFTDKTIMNALIMTLQITLCAAVLSTLIGTLAAIGISAMKKRGTMKHILARHGEGIAHMAEGYTRAKQGNIGVGVCTSGPAATDMITGLYSAQADSTPILAITGQAPRAKLFKEDFQAVDIEKCVCYCEASAHTGCGRRHRKNRRSSHQNGCYCP